MNPAEAALISIHTTEYSSLRTEINAFHATEGQIMNFSIALLGALIAFAAKGGAVFNPLVLIFAPLPFFLLGTFFGYTQIRIIQVASYLNKDLRLRIISVLGRDDIWYWEEFRRNHRPSMCPVNNLATFLSLLRWLLFIWPVSLPIFLISNSSMRSTMTNPALSWLIYSDFMLFFLLLAFGLYCVTKLPDKVR